MKYYYVYKTTNLITSKTYIGKHVSIKENDDYIGSGKLLWRSINKHGIENFKKEIIEYCNNHDILKEREIFWIENENSLYPNGYNIAKGGEGGDLYTNNPDIELIKEKLRQNGYNQSLEHRKAFTKSRLGKSHTAESKKQISESKKGVKFSDEHRKNISEACKKYMKDIPRYNQRKVNCYTKEGIFIKEVESIAQAAREFNQNNREICNMCKEKSFKKCMIESSSED